MRPEKSGRLKNVPIVTFAMTVENNVKKRCVMMECEKINPLSMSNYVCELPEERVSYLKDTIMCLENTIDKISKRIMETDEFNTQSSLIAENIANRTRLEALYRSLAGYAIWLHKEHVKLQCDVLKTIIKVG
jgi:hypothetical protein